MCVDKEKSVVQSVCVCAYVCTKLPMNMAWQMNVNEKFHKRFLKKKHVAFCLKSEKKIKIICKNNKAM